MLIVKTLKNTWLTLGLGISLPLLGHSATIPSTPQTTKGDLLSHSGAVQGRTTLIELLGDYIINIPEKPSSPPCSDFAVRAWNISDPTNPVEVGRDGLSVYDVPMDGNCRPTYTDDGNRFGFTHGPFLNHGAIKRGNEIYIGGWPNDAIRANPDGTLSWVEWSGPDIHWSKSAMMHPWASKEWWNYNTIDGEAWLSLDGVTTATWDHLGQVGVSGFGIFMGNLMIRTSDGLMTGIATYDVSDPSQPVLLDYFNQPSHHTDMFDWQGKPYVWGVGGYWSEASGDRIVFTRPSSNKLIAPAGIQVIDYSDPEHLKSQCEFFPRKAGSGITGETLDSNLMYLNFQDNWVFAGEFKMDVDTCAIDYVLDERGDRDGGEGHWVDTSQYSRPIGNLLLSGGQIRRWNWPADTNGAGMSIWVHDTAADTNPPYVAHHIPRVNQVNYPLMAPLSFSIPETLRSETIIMGDTVTLMEIGGGPVAIDYILSHTGILTVDPIEYLKPHTTYEVTLERIQDAVGNQMLPYTFKFSTGPDIDNPELPMSTNRRPFITHVAGAENIIEKDANAPFVITAEDADNDTLEYRYRFLGGNYGAWSSDNTFSTSFATAGNHAITIQVRDPSHMVSAKVVRLSVVDDISAFNVTNNLTSSQIAHDETNNLLWVANPDNDTITKVDAGTQTVIAEYTVGTRPTSIAVINSNSIWVVAQGDDQIEVYDQNGTLSDKIDLGYGSAPFGIVNNPHNSDAYVSLYGGGEIARLDTNTVAENGRITLGYSARALALSADGQDILITRFVSEGNWGEVWRVNTQTWSLGNTIALHKDLNTDTLDNGRGIPNYLAAAIISEDKTKAYVVGKKDNVDRGLLNGSHDLDDDNTVRTVIMTIDLTTNQEARNDRLDFDNADSPSALAFAPLGNYLFVTMQGRNQIFTLKLDTTDGRITEMLANFSTGHAPQSLHMLHNSNTLAVKNFTDRSLSLFDLDLFVKTGTPSYNNVTLNTVNNEKLAANVLAGKRLFYDSSDGLISQQTITGRISAEGYISCASCHMDGGHDGRTYDFTGRGEGLRNNISLKGRGGTRFGHVHWTANFDEIQDFENDIRNAFLGRGLMSDTDFALTSDTMGATKAGFSTDLDNLAAYVSSLGKVSLARSPYRDTDGSMTDDGLAGAALFEQLECHHCHRPKAFTDGMINDINTTRSYSGKRLNNTLEGIKTPSLLSLFDSAPYLHDGSASTLEDVFISAGGTAFQAEAQNHTGTLVEHTDYSYLRDGGGIRLAVNQTISLTLSSQLAGPGAIAVRYGSSSDNSSLTLTINGEESALPLEEQTQVEGNDVNFIERKLLANFVAGNNTIELKLSSSNGGDTALIDDITVSTADDFKLANAHTKVQTLTQAKQDQLVAYLRQLDQSSAPKDDEVIELGYYQAPAATAPPAAEPKPTLPATEKSGGGGSLHWLSLLGLYGLRRLTHLRR